MTFYPVSYSNVATFFLLKRRRAFFSSWKGITPLPMFYSPLFKGKKKSVCVCLCVSVCWNFKLSIVFMKKYVLVNQMCSLYWGFGSWEIYLYPISALVSGVICNWAEESLRWTAGVRLIMVYGLGSRCGSLEALRLAELQPGFEVALRKWGIKCSICQIRR